MNCVVDIFTVEYNFAIKTVTCRTGVGLIYFIFYSDSCTI